MKFPANTPLRDLNGNPLKDDQTGGVAMCGERIAAALIAPAEKLSLEESTQRFLLAIRFTRASDNNEALDLKSADIERIKNAISNVFGPLVVGQIVGILDEEPAFPDNSDTGA